MISYALLIGIEMGSVEVYSLQSIQSIGAYSEGQDAHDVILAIASAPHPATIDVPALPTNVD